MINLNNLNYKSIEIEDIHAWDAPDYVDAYVSCAELLDGTVLTDEQLDFLQGILDMDKLIQDKLY